METGGIFQADSDPPSDTEGFQDTGCFWPSSPWLSVYVLVCTLCSLCLLRASAACRPPAADPTTGKEQIPELFCPSLQHLSILLIMGFHIDVTPKQYILWKSLVGIGVPLTWDRVQATAFHCFARTD